ncbi:hypothetical protein [Listeria seeligeri]|nr:hypothetical protein [Listeria seeligeri]EFU8668815.1 hypothetical protein [Listeria monocytogenes]MBC1832263.1 hypothetical protein [Listeria seeligeri]MBC1851200.1 hypothetical protein [Listeria seeligeri]MBC1879454.1 hypothetical protein [Listeria seeligeri]MBC6130550.1 hypothetical protein [Listeria seeligeri]
MITSSKRKKRDIERAALAAKNIFEIDGGFKTTTIELHETFVKIKKWGLSSWSKNKKRKKEPTEKIIAYSNLSGLDYKPKSRLLILIVNGKESSNNAINGVNSIDFGKKDEFIILKLKSALEAQIS